MCVYRRRGSQDVEVTLQVEVDNQPERYTLSASLSAVLGLRQATRSTVLHTLWAYIKRHRLQVTLLSFAIQHLVVSAAIQHLVGSAIQHLAGTAA